MCNYKEPIYDDDQFALIQDQQTEQLVGEFVECIITLCNTVADLQVDVNNLTQQICPNAPPIYYELFPDFCQSFEHHPAYIKFEKQLTRLIYE